MGLPNINFAFKKAGLTVVKKGERGIVALIIKDKVNLGAKVYGTHKEVPNTYSVANAEQIRLAFLGGEKLPMSVIVYTLPENAIDYKEAMDYLETCKWHYLACPADITTTLCTAVATWIRSLRENLNKDVKVVLPVTSADHEGVVNFTTDINKNKEGVLYNAKQYCARVVGLLAGTPLQSSATFFVLNELADCTRLTKTQLDSAIDAGQFILFNDGEKVKVARAVNSLVNLTGNKVADFKKCKIVDILDAVQTDIRRTSEDNYIGKCPNTYDDKCLLISAINLYFDELIKQGIFHKVSANSVQIDMTEQIAYLKAQGEKVEEMSEREIKEADTDSTVFITGIAKPVDAIEDIKVGLSL